MKRGQFITFEGIDGAGKSTHMAWLRSWLTRQAIPHYFTREPGGTELAEKIRTLLLTEQMDSATETLLMFAARKTHIENVILPNLNAGIWVISDRFTDATYAYQGGGRGVDWQQIAVLEKWVQADFQPDLTVLFDISPEQSAARLSSTRSLDRFEQEKGGFFARVRDAYLQRLAESRGRIVRIDASQDIATIQTQLVQLLAAHIQKVRS